MKTLQTPCKLCRFEWWQLCRHPIRGFSRVDGYDGRPHWKEIFGARPSGEAECPDFEAATGLLAIRKAIY
jgi:hypothetical protein